MLYEITLCKAHKLSSVVRLLEAVEEEAVSGRLEIANESNQWTVLQKFVEFQQQVA